MPEHSKIHTHEHVHESHDSANESLALLRYMIDHNTHHTAELQELAQGFCPQAQEMIRLAVDSYAEGTKKLAMALDFMEKK